MVTVTDMRFLAGLPEVFLGRLGRPIEEHHRCRSPSDADSRRLAVLRWARALVTTARQPEERLSLRRHVDLPRAESGA